MRGQHLFSVRPHKSRLTIKTHFTYNKKEAITLTFLPLSEQASIHLKVIGKEILTQPLQSKIREGEKNADTVMFHLNRYYGNLDLSGLTFTLQGGFDGTTAASQVLEKADAPEEHEILLLWRISSLFTSKPGQMVLELTGRDDAENICIRFSGKALTILPALHEPAVTEING